MFLITLLGSMTLTAASDTGKHDALEQSFITPAAHSKPWVYWDLMNGNVTREGLRADLESMALAGLGGALASDIGMGLAGPVKPRSPQWVDNVGYTLKEAERLGLQLGFNCPGWANSGGPWVTPELSMQELAWSETVVEGGRRIETVLPQPAARLNYYRDIAVFAFPTPLHDEISLRTVQITITDASGTPLPEGGKLFDNDPETVAKLPGIFELHTAVPVSARSIAIRASCQSRFFTANLEAWDDARKAFVPVGKVQYSPSGLNDRPSMGSATFEPVTANRFRLAFMTGYGEKQTQPAHVFLQELNMYGGFRVQRWTNKVGFGNGAVISGGKEPQPKPEEAIALDRVVELTGRMNAEGGLTWDAPTGRWTVVRMGHIPTGAQSEPLPFGMQALEVDKYSREACDTYYDGMMKPILQSVGPEIAKKVVANHHVDSYEVGWQNWTLKFPSEFKARRGYDIASWLPALTGRVVGSLDQTESFCWDFRRTICDCYADHHIGRLAQRCHEDGLFFSTEAYDGPFEYLQAGGRSDVPMTEIWINSPIGTRPRMAASSAGHIYERQIIGSEEFTGLEKWDQHPATMKALADWSYCVGVNRLLMVVFTGQPWTDPHMRPGMTLGPWGCHLDRGITWWLKGGPQWHEYLGRCQAILQQGSPVADVLYYLGDDAPNGDGNNPPAPPLGYDSDGLNGEILARLKVADGKLMLPGGKSYRYLVMPERGLMTLASLGHVARLVRDGATVLGPKPKGSPSFADQGGTEKFTALADGLWGDGAAAFGERKVGAGRVSWGRRLENVMKADGLVPDFEYDPNAGLDLHFTHRSIAGDDAYFVANSSPRGAWVNCQFRVNGKVPELWYPESGKIELAPIYEQTPAGMRVGLNLKQEESVFVVFRKPLPSGHPSTVVGLSRNGHEILPAAMPCREDLSGTFTMTFWARPTAEIALPAPRTRGVDSNGQNFAVYPPAGQLLYGEKGHAGAGVSVGINGVCVLEASSYNFPAVLSWKAPQPLEGWVHVAVVYSEGVPELFINGKPVGTGLKGENLAHAGVGVTSPQAPMNKPFQGKVLNLAKHARAMTEAELTQLAQTTPEIYMTTDGLLALTADASGSPQLLAARDGQYEVKLSGGGRQLVAVPQLPEPVRVGGPWQLEFPAGWGAPEKVTFDKLVSWPDHPDSGIRYFSGTATYRTSFVVPAEWRSSRCALTLDLGDVQVIAEVKVNGKSLGTLWKPPFRLDVTDAAKEGANALEVKVTNLWPNRLIGDEQYPDDCTPNGTWVAGGIPAWPEWLQKGLPRPEPRRLTFTTFKHWKKDDNLLPSGLIGPVVIRVTEKLAFQNDR